MPDILPGVMPGQRKVATALVAAMLLFALYLSQGMNANAAPGTTHEYNSYDDICEKPGATFNVAVGDVVEITEDFRCVMMGDPSPWMNLWNYSETPAGEDYLYIIGITQAGTATVEFENGRSATITTEPGTTVPHAPQDVSATAGNAQATVSFTAPADDGGAAITGYTVTSSPGGLTASGASSPLIVTGLTNGTTYTFTVTATNSVGTGNASASSNAVTPVTVPGAPTAVSAIALNAQAYVWFAPPADSGGSAITGYTVTSSPGNVTATGANSPILVTGLTNGTEYTFTVTATTSVGTGNPSAATNAVTPMGVPGAPQNVSATAGNAQATVTFDAPASDGGSAITGYTVTSNPGGFTGTGASSPITVTGLTNGTSYTFTVTAKNSIGTGEASSASNAVTPAGLPGAPQTVVAMGDFGAAWVWFQSPSSDGGSPITGYTVTASPGGQTMTTPSSPTVMMNLEPGIAYTFTVTATNAVGTGPASSPSNAVTPFGPPSAPLHVTATADNAQATVTFDAPTSDGGSAITGYTVTSSPGGQTASGAHSPLVVEGLTNGVEYTFTVTATNNVGTGEPSSASNAVTPLGVSGAPMHVTASAGNGQATVSFDAPNDNGGSAITGYTVTASPGGQSASGHHSPIVVEGLANGVEYTFTVIALNNQGKSPASSASNAVTPQGGTHITLNTSPASSVYGQGFALVANVSGEGTPTGTVVFLRNGTEIGSAELDANGDATLAIDPGYAVGAHSFRAVYGGSAAYESAESNIATHTVAKALSTIDLAVSHSHLLVGETVTLTATVPMAVTGTVTFTAGSETLGTASIVDGVATIDALFAIAGDQDVVATSSGDASYVGATDSLTVTVHTIVEDDTTPPTTPSETPTETPSETPTPGETPDPTATPEVPTTPETPDNGTPDDEPTNEPTTGLTESAPKGTTVIKVSNPGDFKVGDVIVINQGTPNEERRTIVAIDERGIVLNAGLDFTHEAGVSVVLSAGSQPVVPPATDPTAQPGAPLPPNSGTGLRIIETGPLFALPLVLAVLLLAAGALAYGTRKQS